MVSLLQIVVLVVFLGSQTHEAAVLNMQVPMNMTCPDPGTPDHASREDDLNSFLHGDKVIFTCEFTYQLIGSQTRTCLADGTWSGEQPVCRKFMCDELDAEIPKHGKRFGLNFNFGGQLTFKCSRNYLLIGEEKLTCLPSGQWSAKSPTCRHRCVQSPCRGKGERCQVVGGATECVCRDNMDCSSKLESVCGSDAVTYNNECIMNATACRKKKDIRKIKSGKCEPGDICSIYPESNCRASFSMYYYNVTTRSCRHMVAGGCHASGWNGFWTRKECKDECQKDVCVLPADRGLCDKKETRWYYDNDKKSCQEFEYGGCFGNRNNFRTRDDCEERCGKKI